MPHVSKRKLHPKVSRRISEELVSVFEKITRSYGASAVVGELFTETEKVMFAKRIAIILMLSNGFSQHRIIDILKISPVTLSKFSLRLEKGKYNMLLKASRKEKIDIEKLVWSILTVGGIMPPVVGKSYWKKVERR